METSAELSRLLHLGGLSNINFIKVKITKSFLIITLPIRCVLSCWQKEKKKN